MSVNSIDQVRNTPKENENDEVAENGGPDVQKSESDLEIETEETKDVTTQSSGSSSKGCTHSKQIAINHMLGIPTEMSPDLVIVTREEWGAKPPTRVYPKPHLTTIVVFTYSTDTKPCFTPEQCTRRVKRMQRRCMKLGRPDIPHNFLVGGDGRIYEGRGWHANPETIIKYIKLKGFFIEIAYIGNYRVERPSEAMFDAALELIQYGRENVWIRDRFSLIENYE